MREANLYRGKREDTNAWVKGYHVVIGSIDMTVVGNVHDNPGLLEY